MKGFSTVAWIPMLVRSPIDRITKSIQTDEETT